MGKALQIVRLSLSYHLGRGEFVLIETVFMDTTGLENPQLLEKALPFFAEERKERIRKLKNPSAARLSAGAGLLLYFALEKNGLADKLEEIQTGRHGKPFLSESGFFFSLSHSGSLALCAFGDAALGADIQQIKEPIPQKTSKIFSSQEKEYLLSKEGRGRVEAFYKIWTRKESLMKWDGRGLRLPMQGFSVVQNDMPVSVMAFEGKTVFFRDYKLPGYVISICVEQGVSERENKICDKSIKELLKSDFFH